MPAAPQSFAAKSQEPVYALAFASPDTLIYAGGGGQSKSGIANAIHSATVDEQKRSLSERGSIKLSSSEDAPMCIAATAGDDDDEEEEEEEQKASESARGQEPNKNGPSSSSASRPMSRKIVVGINGSLDASGTNANIRLFDWTSAKAGTSKVQQGEDVQHHIGATTRAQSIQIKDPDTYIRSCAISPDGNYLAIGGTDGQMALHSFPSLHQSWCTPAVEGEGIVDACFSADSALVAFVTPKKIAIYPTASGPATSSTSVNGLQGAPEPFQTIRNPSLKGTSGCVFRAARFGRSARVAGTQSLTGASNRLFTIVNSNPPAGLGSSRKDRELAKIRKCFITSWDTDSWKLIKTRQVSERPATVMEISPNGKHIAVSTSDLSLHLLSTASLRSIWRLKDVHAFPGTCLAFGPRGDILASGSADMSLRIASVGPQQEPSAATSLLEKKYSTFILALLLAFLAWQMQGRIVPSTSSVKPHTSSASSEQPSPMHGGNVASHESVSGAADPVESIVSIGA